MYKLYCIISNTWICIFFKTEEQIKVAAKEVAKVVKGDTQKTELELLSKVLNVKTTSEDNSEVKEDDSLRLKKIFN